MMGPMNYVYHLFSAPRLPFTAAYFGSIIMTLVFALKVSIGTLVYLRKRCNITDVLAAA